MQQFLADYGLWLLVGLLIVIAVAFLLTRGGTAEPEDVTAIEPAAPTPTPAPEPAAIVGDLPVLPVVEMAPAPVEAAPVPVSPSVTEPSETDDLLRLKGVGPKLNSLLISLGVTRFDQIANWTEADLAKVDAQLGTFKGRPVRDQWIDQAKSLAAGDVAGFEAKYGKL
jgi:predicted flap endonuclease-1-like 5' DNA nuclease